jgi:hypothetical protein
VSSAEIQMAAAVLNTGDTLSHSPDDNGSGTLRRTLAAYGIG